MRLITPLLEFDNIKSRGLVVLECEHCHKEFTAIKSQVQKVLAGYTSLAFKFCSQSCMGESISKKHNVVFNCETCGKVSKANLCKYKKSKHHFCSSSCSALFSNKHRSFGNKRSKAEDYLISLIFSKFPNLKIIKNDRKLLNNNLEIDILLPELPLAVEINGPVHYFNIWGKLSLIQSRDQEKQKELEYLKIPMIIINISELKCRKKCFNFLDKEFKTIEQIIGELIRLRSESQGITVPFATITTLAP